MIFRSDKFITVVRVVVVMPPSIVQYLLVGRSTMPETTPRADAHQAGEHIYCVSLHHYYLGITFAVDDQDGEMYGSATRHDTAWPLGAATKITKRARTCVVVCAGIMKRSLDSKVRHVEALRYNNQTFAKHCSMHYFHLAYTYNSSTQDILVTNTQRTCAGGAAALPMLLSAVVRALQAACTAQNIH